MPRPEYHDARIGRDFSIILISIVVAVILINTGVINTIINSFESPLVAAFIAGIFFTSAFTTPIAIATLGQIGLTTPLLEVAFIGALGSIIGDVVIFFFVKDALAHDVEYLLRAPKYKRIKTIFRHRFFRWLTPLVGALIIATPLPDEIGIAMMGLSHMNTKVLMVVSFVMNFIGIYLIGYAFSALAL